MTITFKASVIKNKCVLSQNTTQIVLSIETEHVMLYSLVAVVA